MKVAERHLGCTRAGPHCPRAHRPILTARCSVGRSSLPAEVVQHQLGCAQPAGGAMWERLGATPGPRPPRRRTACARAAGWGWGCAAVGATSAAAPAATVGGPVGSRPRGAGMGEPFLNRFLDGDFSAAAPSSSCSSPSDATAAASTTAAALRQKAASSSRCLSMAEVAEARPGTGAAGGISPASGTREGRVGVGRANMGGGCCPPRLSNHCLVHPRTTHPPQRLPFPTHLPCRQCGAGAVPGRPRPAPRQAAAGWPPSRAPGAQHPGLRAQLGWREHPVWIDAPRRSIQPTILR